MLLRRVCRARWDVLAVCTERGDCALLDFLEGLEGHLAKEGTRAELLLERVAAQGPRLGNEISKPLGGEIFELRFGSIRMLWFYDAGQVVVVTHGFVKKGQKTPPVEIRRAEQARKEYFEALRGGRLRIENRRKEGEV